MSDVARTLETSSPSNVCDGGPPLKRNKLDLEPGDITLVDLSVKHAVLERHPDYWYDDGNVVIAVKNMAFRVHASIITRESERLKALLDAQKDHGSSEMMDGCPVVRMTGDYVGDWTNLIAALYDFRRFAVEGHIMKDFFLISLARLGIKYDIRGIEDMAISRLREYLPSTLKAWDLAPKLDNKHSAIALVEIARGRGSMTMLCGALCECCMLDKHSLLNGYHHNDGDNHLDMLSSEDIQRCWEGTETLASLIRAHMSFFFTLKSSERCKASDTCKASLAQLPRKAIEAELFHSLPFAIYGTNLDSLISSCGLCLTCGKVVKSRFFQARRKIWCKLPEVFKMTVRHWEVMESSDTVTSEEKKDS